MQLFSSNGRTKSEERGPPGGAGESQIIGEKIILKIFDNAENNNNTFLMLKKCKNY